MVYLFIENKTRIKAHRGTNFNHWDAIDWVRDVEKIAPRWSSFSVGWEENLMCGMVRKK